MAASNYKPLADKFIKVLQWAYRAQLPENYADKVIIALLDDTMSTERTVHKLLTDISIIHDDIFCGKTNITPAQVDGYISNQLIPAVRHTPAGQLLEDSVTSIRNPWYARSPLANHQTSSTRDLSSMVKDVNNKQGWKEKTLAILWALTKALGLLIFTTIKYVLWGLWIVLKWLGQLALQQMGAIPKHNATNFSGKQAGRDNNLEDYEKKVRNAQYAAQDAKLRNMIADMEHKIITESILK